MVVVAVAVAAVVSQQADDDALSASAVGVGGIRLGR